MSRVTPNSLKVKEEVSAVMSFLIITFFPKKCRFSCEISLVSIPLTWSVLYYAAAKLQHERDVSVNIQKRAFVFKNPKWKWEEFLSKKRYFFFFTLELIDQTLWNNSRKKREVRAPVTAMAIFSWATLLHDFSKWRPVQRTIFGAWRQSRLVCRRL